MQNAKFSIICLSFFNAKCKIFNNLLEILYSTWNFQIRQNSCNSYILELILSFLIFVLVTVFFINIQISGFLVYYRNRLDYFPTNCSKLNSKCNYFQNVNI